MALDFKVKDVTHRVTVKFTPSFLPTARKPYTLRAVFQPELDIHGIASKADIFNITTPPKVIEEGLTAGIELIYYLAASGYKIRTPLFTLHIRVPGEYEGDETRLPDGVFPEGSLRVSDDFRQYLREAVQVLFDGVDTDEGLIAEAVDEATGLSGQAVTIDNLLTIRGAGLKVEADEEHAGEAGLFFETEDGARVRAKALAVNEPRHLKALTPAALTAGTAYRLVVVTQSRTTHGAGLLKEIREVKSAFTLTARSDSGSRNN